MFLILNYFLLLFKTLWKVICNLILIGALQNFFFCIISFTTVTINWHHGYWGTWSHESSPQTDRVLIHPAHCWHTVRSSWWHWASSLVSQPHDNDSLRDWQHENAVEGDVESQTRSLTHLPGLQEWKTKSMSALTRVNIKTHIRNQSDLRPHCRNGIFCVHDPHWNDFDTVIVMVMPLPPRLSV